MKLGTLIAAESTWPEAAVAIAGIALVGSVIAVVVWQAMATWRARIAVTREQAYRQLAEQLARELQQLNERLGAGDRPSEGHRS